MMMMMMMMTMGVRWGAGWSHLSGTSWDIWGSWHHAGLEPPGLENKRLLLVETFLFQIHPHKWGNTKEIPISCYYFNHPGMGGPQSCIFHTWIICFIFSHTEMSWVQKFWCNCDIRWLEVTLGCHEEHDNTRIHQHHVPPDTATSSFFVELSSALKNKTENMGQSSRIISKQDVLKVSIEDQLLFN